MQETNIESPKESKESPKLEKRKPGSKPNWVRKARSPKCKTPPMMLDDKS